MEYYEIAPLGYNGSDKGVFTYESELELSPGMLVSIPFRNSHKQAVVLSKSAGKPAFATKSVTKIIMEKPVISENMLSVANWISEYYMAGLGAVLSCMLPVDLSKNRRAIKAAAKNNKPLEAAKKLTSDQATIVKEIIESKDNKPHLLFGVTGSGKTEIYMQLIEEELRVGKSAIVLVPEVSLTPQAVTRFQDRFGDRVALLHSYQKETERAAAWKAVYEGTKDIVVGPRSAIFAPAKNLGIIIIDEAHEGSYKQDQTPRYQTVDVAKKMSEVLGARLVLGTATPTIEQLYAAKSSDYHLRVLNTRIVQSSMPRIDIVDMRDEFHYGNKSIFSEVLQAKIKDALTAQKQIMLFINRRGMSTFVTCRDCGYVSKCPKCDIPLTFHYDNFSLECHHCGYRTTSPTVCPECKSLAIKFFGTGTQKVEHEIHRLFGDKIRVSRMDRDTTQKTGSHEALYNNFAQNNADILIGTQMIAKGWDIENVGLIGVISADAMLNMPDYLASERAFSLMVQIAGRTGRGKELGEVVVQTYNPDNVAFQYLAKHDYSSFYESELEKRRELRYPPFAKIIKLLYNNSDIDKVKTETERVANDLRKLGESIKPENQVTGPSPALVGKINNIYRYQIVIKYDEKNSQKVREIVKQTINKDWVVDIDPVGLI